MRGLFTVCFGLVVCLLHAQISLPEKPISFSPEFQQRYGAEPIRGVDLPDIQVESIQAVDETNGWTNRFAVPSRTNLNLENSGSWTVLTNGDRLWRLRIKTSQAKGLAALYKDFYLPEGARLFMYSPDRKVVLGAYSAANNNASKTFLNWIYPRG